MVRFHQERLAYAADCAERLQTAPKANTGERSWDTHSYGADPNTTL
jgi:hypothetical protein